MAQYFREHALVSQCTARTLSLSDTYNIYAAKAERIRTSAEGDRDGRNGGVDGGVRVEVDQERRGAIYRKSEKEMRGGGAYGPDALGSSPGVPGNLFSNRRCC